MSENQAVTLEIADGIATITLNRPERLNAFNRDQCLALNDAVAKAAANDEARVVILTGSGRAFSTGADLKEGISSDQSLVDRLNDEFLPAIAGIRDMNKPVIAAVNGPAAGIGVAYVLSCDLALMDESAYMMQPFINISLVPDGGITWDLVRQLGHKRAYEFIVSADPLPSKRCVELGLINRSVSDGTALAEARTWAKSLLDKAPLALGYSKQALRRSADGTFDDGFQNEAQLQEICAASADCAEGIAAFVEKRSAKFRGC